MHTLHLISHTHWDREWYLTFQQFRLKLVRLVDNLLDLLDADPNYRHFMLDGQTIVLEDYLAIRPEREADLRRHVQSGRVLIGPWYLLPDEFLVSPEATIRNLLEGERLARPYGARMMVGYIPDPFGHIGQMPQILRGFGIGTASVMRGLDDQPCEFWWQAPDGSRVLMGYLRNGYGNAAGILGGGEAGFVSEAARQRDSLAPHAAAAHHLLMHGTDHMEPQPGTSAAVAYAAGKLDGDCLVHSTLPDYFAALQAELDLDALPVVCGELRSSKRAPMLPAVLSARMWIKQRNRACETLLEKWAEPFSAWASLAQADARRAAPASPAVLLRGPWAVTHQAWKLLMQCHPHDSICGCSIDPVHDEMRARFDQVEQMGEEITRQSLLALAGQADTQPPASVDGEAISAILVYNPTPQPQTGPVSVVLEALPENGGLELADASGAVVPYQRVGLGGSELANMALERGEFMEMFGMVADGVVAGLMVREMQVRVTGSEAAIEMVLVEEGRPNLAAWEQGRRQVEQALADPAVSLFRIRARAAEATRLVFTAQDVPGLGYRTYWVRGRAAARPQPAHISPLARALAPLAVRIAASPAGRRLIEQFTPDPTRRPPYRIENEFLAVEACPDGTLEVLDKTTGACYSGQNRLVDSADRGDEYNYAPLPAGPLPAGPLPADPPIAARLKGIRVMRGAVQQTLEVCLDLTLPEELAPDRAARSARKVTLPITSRVTLTPGLPRVDIHTEVENLARDHRLRVHFAAPFAVTSADYDGHFEIVRRPVGLPASDATWVEQPRPETCQRAFTALYEEGPAARALLIANRGLPEVEVMRHAVGGGADSAGGDRAAVGGAAAVNGTVRGSSGAAGSASSAGGDSSAVGATEIAVTLLRCVGWLSRDDFPERKGHAGPGLPTPGAQLPGKWSFDYAILPHSAPARLAAIHAAYAFEAPLRAAGTTLHPGPLPAAASFLEVEQTQFAISAVKLPEDGRPGWLARGCNLSGEDIQVTLRTLRPFTHAHLSNLAEEPGEALASTDGRTVQFTARAHQVVTVRFEE